MHGLYTEQLDTVQVAIGHIIGSIVMQSIGRNALHTLTFLPLFLEAPEEVAAYVTPSRAGKREYLGSERKATSHTCISKNARKTGPPNTTYHYTSNTSPKITKPDKISTVCYQFQWKFVGAHLAVSVMTLGHNYM